MIVKPFDKPESQFTQAHNSIFDVIMRQCTGSEWKVLCAIFRKTRGWDKVEDDISYSQIKELTGISSSSTVSKAVQGLVSKRMVIVSGSFGVTSHYQLNIDYTIEQTCPESVQVESEESDLSKNCTGSCPESVHPTCPESVHTKDIKSLNKEINNKESSHLLQELIKRHSLEQTPSDRKIVGMLKRCRPTSDRKGTLILQTPNIDDFPWLKGRLTASAERYLTGIAGNKVTVKFEYLEKR